MKERFKDQVTNLVSKINKRDMSFPGNPIIEEKKILMKKRLRRISLVPVIRKEIKSRIVQPKKKINTNTCGGCSR